MAGTISGLNAIRLCGYAFGMIITAAPQAAIYRRFVDAVPPAEPQVVVRDVACVDLEGISYTYPGTDRPALRDVSIRAERGSGTSACWCRSSASSSSRCVTWSRSVRRTT
ncbi:hypothetical protein ACQPXM_17075 [Kribbella sp. CA-253562]|uniref:hypothetical protein n=1 Tax=Kribbella sp. CA-253562 TaxID=3239942 RepID=UPI003D8B91A0